MSALLRVVILEVVGFSDFVIGEGAMGYFLVNVEDSAKEEEPAL